MALLATEGACDEACAAMIQAVVKPAAKPE